jgi:hypothetical protein
MNKTPRLLIKAAASAGLEAGSLAPNASAAADQAGAAEKAQADKVDGGRPLHGFDQILEHSRVVQHGVSR